MEAGQYIYGQILSKLSLQEAIKVAKSGSKLAKAALLYYPWDLSQKMVCLAFKDIDLSVLLKNANIDRMDLFECSMVLKNEALALMILSIAKNNPEKKEYQVDLGVDDYVIVDASKNGMTDLVKILLDEYGANPSYNYNTAIILALRNGHDVVVDLLVESPKFDYRYSNLITLALDYQAENILIKIIEKSKIDDELMSFIFKKAVENGMLNLVAYTIKKNKVSTESIKTVVSDLVVTYERFTKKSSNNFTKIVSTARKIIKLLVDKYRNDRNPNFYPKFILDIIDKSIYNLKMFKMMMEETNINTDYYNILLLLAADKSPYDRHSIEVAKYLLTEYKDLVDPSINNFKVFWSLFDDRHTLRISRLLNMVIYHPKMKYNSNLDVTVLREIYKYKYKK